MVNGNSTFKCTLNLPKDTKGWSIWSLWSLQLLEINMFSNCCNHMETTLQQLWRSLRQCLLRYTSVLSFTRCFFFQQSQQSVSDKRPDLEYMPGGINIKIWPCGPSFYLNLAFILGLVFNWESTVVLII